jgi:hypothetical protein
MIEFDELRITNGEPFHKDKWNGLLDWVAENPPNLSDDALRLRVPDGAVMKIAAAKQSLQPGAGDSLAFYAESSTSGSPKRLMAITDSGELILSATTNPGGTAAGSRCRAMADLGNQLGINNSRDFSNGVLLGGKLRVQASNGYLEVNPTSVSAQINTDSSRFVFNKEIRAMTGKIGSASEDLVLATSGVERMRIHNGGGWVGIGTNAPKTTLHVNGSRLRVSKPGDETHYVDLRADGSALDLESSKPLYLNNNGQQIYYRKMNQVSSRKFKKAIQLLSSSKAAKLLELLRPVKYQYKTDTDERPRFGFIAEEMPEEIAAHDKASINPMDIVTILCKVVQDHQRKLAALQK